MKKLHAKILFLFFYIGVIFNSFSQQLVNTGSLFQGGVADGVKLVEYYIKPVNKAIISGINNTEYNSLKIYEDTPKRLSISIRISTIIIPEKDRQFRVDTMQFQKIKVDSGIYAQTVFGDTIRSVVFVSKDSTLGYTNDIPPQPYWKPVFSFHSAPGSGYHIMPIPYLQAAYNFGFGNLSVNLVPATPLLGSDMNLLLFGAAWQQNLLPFLKDKPFVLSGIAGFNTIRASAHLHIEPDPSIISFDKNTYDNQFIKINYLNLFATLYGSYHFSQKLLIYGGAGYTWGESLVNVLGTYPVYQKDPTGATSVTVDNIEDPMKNSQTVYNRIKAVVGTQINLGNWYIQANYTIAEYSGLGIVLGIKI